MKAECSRYDCIDALLYFVLSVQGKIGNDIFQYFTPRLIGLARNFYLCSLFPPEISNSSKV